MGLNFNKVIPDHFLLGKVVVSPPLSCIHVSSSLEYDFLSSFRGEEVNLERCSWDWIPEEKKGKVAFIGQALHDAPAGKEASLQALTYEAAAAASSHDALLLGGEGPDGRVQGDQLEKPSDPHLGPLKVCIAACGSKATTTTTVDEGGLLAGCLNAVLRGHIGKNKAEPLESLRSPSAVPSGAKNKKPQKLNTTLPK